MEDHGVNKRSSSSHEIHFGGLVGAILGVSVFGVALAAVGLASPGWSLTFTDRGDRVNEGLFEVCSCNGRVPYDDWFKATQALTILGLIFFLLAMIAVICYAFFHFLSKTATLMLLMFFCFAAVFFYVIGLCIYGAQRGNKLNWGFGITCMAAICSCFTGILSSVQLCRAKCA